MTISWEEQSTKKTERYLLIGIAKPNNENGIDDEFDDIYGDNLVMS